MKIKLPKDLRGVVFQRVLMIDVSDFDIDLFLPALFFTILSGGRGRARKANDPKTIDRYVSGLAEHQSVEGFTNAEGRKILDRLVRTALIVTGRVGIFRRDEQILSTVPYTLLAHKPGFPTGASRHRNADIFIYQLLLERMGGADDTLRAFIKDVFGKGIRVGNLPTLGGEYDGITQLDTLTRLSIAFLDGMQTTGVGSTRTKVAPSACPRPAREFAADLLQYLFAYHTLMPERALTYYLQALINFELFIYTTKLVHAINELVGNPDVLSTVMLETVQVSAPQIYVDFTGGQSGLSQEMARACVRRDMEAYQQFLFNNLLLRLLDRYAETIRRMSTQRAEIDAVLPSPDKGPYYLQRLLQLQKDPLMGPLIQASARVDEDRIRRESVHDDENEDLSESTWIDELVSGAGSEIERVVTLLVEAQRARALKNFVGWFSGVGGLTKPHGLLQGTVGKRQNWRYEPSNDLLAVLVQLAAAREPVKEDSPGREVSPQPIRLQDFLAFLETRFGVIVDRPPSPFAGADYAAAARDNLQAMLGRLRQMGIFRDLSDDFTVQRLEPPYAIPAASEPGGRKRVLR